MIKFNISCLIIIFLICTKINGQNTSNEYWNAVLVAGNYYDNAAYQEAAAAYKLVWATEYDDEIANHRLHAAAANCMIDNEEGVKENLFKIIDVASKTDRKRVLVNYQIFDKYKDRAWWSALEEGLNERISELIAHHKNLKVFKHRRNIVYSAIRINSNGDTIANSQITLIPDGTGWGDEAASSQSQVIYKYKCTLQDSIDHYNEVDSIVGRKFWNSIDTTGVVENSKKIWMHPFRNNEFFKTELAPFPEVNLPISDSKNHSFKNATHIMSNWGWYNNTETKCQHEYIRTVNKIYAATGAIQCYQFNSTGDNTRYGSSTLEYYFNEQFGFTEMNYLTYDGDIIEFKIVEINYIE